MAELAIDTNEQPKNGIADPEEPARIEEAGEASATNEAQNLEEAEEDDPHTPSVICSPSELQPGVDRILQAIQAARGLPLFVIIENSIDYRLPTAVYRWRRELKAAAEHGPIDILINSPGGGLTECFRTARLLERYTNCWTALVPEMAASGATLICLGASEIVLPDIAFLGPVDPQVKSKRSGKFFEYERQSPIEAFQAVQYLRQFTLGMIEAGTGYLIGEQGVAPQLALETATNLSVELARPLLEKIEPYDLGSFSLDSSMALRYCREIAKPADLGKRTQRKARINTLVEDYPAHEFVIDRAEASSLGFTVSEPDEALEDLFDQLRPYLGVVSTYVGLVSAT